MGNKGNDAEGVSDLTAVFYESFNRLRLSSVVINLCKFQGFHSILTGNFFSEIWVMFLTLCGLINSKLRVLDIKFVNFIPRYNIVLFFYHFHTVSVN